MKTLKTLSVADDLLWLNHGVRSRLPVPEGIVLLDGGWDRLIEDGVVVVDGEDVRIDSADTFLQRFALNSLHEPVTVRPTHSPTTMTLPPTDRDALIRAVVKLWMKADDVKRRDIVVSKAIRVQTGGIATIMGDAEFDTVELEGERLELEKLQGFFRGSKLEGWQRRLQLLLRGVRRSYNLLGRDWQLEWADDGRDCWLLWVSRTS